MAHIFRLHNNGANTNTDWNNSLPYGTNVINQIIAPNGATARKEITSIPSPFARIALVKNAFKEVVESKNMDGDTIYHKMVSDALDVAEIFFNFNTLKHLFQIITWDLTDLESLKNTHPEVYNALDIFIKQDDKVYNFDKMKRLYILVYMGPNRKSQMDVVGATSPATLFFTPANDLSYISQEISFGNDHPFDGEYQPLYKRDSKFIEYLFAFRQSYGTTNFAQYFEEVNKYLDETFNALPFNLKQDVDNLNANSIQNFQILNFNNANTVDILGYPYHTKPIQTNISSGFEISQTHFKGSKMPLVLPVESGNQYANVFYVQANWGNQNKAPYFDSNNWQNRTLPFSGIPYPYLTIDDFLEDTILMYPHLANDQDFFFGNWDNTRNTSVMLPIKPLFFEFYSIEQLINGIDGTPMLSMRTINGEDINVTLTIPISEGSITYTRNYYKNSSPDVNRNRGGIKILDSDFGLAMMPLVLSDNTCYRIAITHKFRDTSIHQIECYRNGQKLSNGEEIIRNTNDNSYLKAHIFAYDLTSIDSIRVCVGHVYGFVIPLCNNSCRNKTYSFAIDFGTTNTHIEYSDGINAASAFDINENDKQLVFWANFSAATEKLLEAELVPKEIGNKFNFPARTVLSEAGNVNWETNVIPMAQTNVPIVYGHRVIHKYNEITTDLKWSNEPQNSRRVESYIENLMILMRNKVLIGGGTLDKTQIVWFYPASMTVARRNVYERLWQSSYQKYFGNQLENIKSVMESVAPYEHFRSTTQAASRMVSVDIGGETTDVVFAEKGQINYTTSFRFAANTIFGDGYTSNATLNGIVNDYTNRISNILNSNDLSELENIHNELKNKGLSTELASFYFSLKNDDKVKEKNIANLLDWNVMLQQDNDFKVVFLIFYTAIIYHIANIMKLKGLALPRHIAFSGNGAKVVSILSPNNNTLAEYTKDIFCRVFGYDKYDIDGLDIILMDNPKIATCKGGINILRNNINVSVGDKVILRTINEQMFFTENDTYKLINDTLKQSVVKDVRDLLDFIFKNKTHFSIKNNFGIENDVMERAFNICQKDLGTFFDNGLTEKQKENQDNDPIEETLFFYPMIGMLHELSENIKN